MNDPDTDRRHDIGLFRYGLIAELVQLPPGSKGLYEHLAAKAALDYSIPGSSRTRVAAETLRDWLKAYRRGGFEALLPKERADRGQVRALPAAVAEALLAAKEDNRNLSVQLVIREARKSPEVPADLPLPLSTVHRLLARHGLMAKPKEDPGDHDRRRFAFAQAGELWMSDVMHGPSVGVGDRTKRKTYLIAFIDDATRVVPYAAFALSENTQTFLPVLQQAILRRGLPQRLYVDNGANYRSQQLALVCAKLGIALIHARPYRPQGKGKIERFFRTVRAQVLTRLTAEDTASLTALNRRLAAWIEGEYHHSPHRGLAGLTPLEQWAQSAEGVRFPEPGLDLTDLFLFEAKRKVQKDRTVSLNGVVYEVDAALVGETVLLRFDPAAPPERPVQVCHQGRPSGLARVVQTYANCFVKRERPSRTLSADGPAPQPPASALRLRELDGGGELMYRKHFALTAFPFDVTPQPDALFPSAALGEAEARLKHLLELRAIGLVTGEAGSGKTTVCRKVAAALHPGLYRVFYVPLSTGNVLDMYKSIGWELGLPIERNRAAAFRAIRGEISRLTLEARQRPVLIVDEAHHLRNEVLEDLRLLTNYQMDSENRLCLLLVGLTELRRRLAMAVHESLAQRIVVRYHLAGLTREEVPEYLIHRLRLAGCELPLFEPPAVEALFQATQGMPRKINRLAHYALTSAALGQARTVTAEHVQTAREEIAP